MIRAVLVWMMVLSFKIALHMKRKLKCSQRRIVMRMVPARLQRAEAKPKGGEAIQ